jgi:hypothetical protein
MVKIGIVTLYTALNYGAFLQAYALQNILKNLGYESEFLNPKTSVIDEIKYGSFIRKDPQRVIFNIKKYCTFKHSLSKMRIANKISNVSTEYYDTVILGSDEIWNLCNSSFKHLPLFFGNGINTNNLITYAASCGETTTEQIKNDPNAQKGYSIINHFSARDENTASTIEALTGKKATPVLDPTLLFGNFNQVEENIDIKKYILIYTYGFNGNQIKRIKEFARTKNLKMISAGFYYKWCDMNLPVTAFTFLTLVKNADYVITPSYHGVIFSIIYKKQFGVFTHMRMKVESILRQFDLNDRILDENKNIEDIIDKEIDYPKVESLLGEKRRQSIEYLKNALGQSKGEFGK